MNLRTMKIKELVALFNTLAPADKQMKGWKGKASELGKKIMTQAPDAGHTWETEFEAPQSEVDKQAGRAPLADRVDNGTATETELAEIAEEQAAGNLVDEPPPTKSKAAKKPAKAKKAKKAKAVKKAGAAKTGEIKAFVEAQLLKAKGHDEKTKKPLGLTYAEVLSNVQEKFPKASTTLNCLRWYATHMNKRRGADKVEMPLRPKSKVA